MTFRQPSLEFKGLLVASGLHQSRAAICHLMKLLQQLHDTSTLVTEGQRALRILTIMCTLDPELPRQDTEGKMETELWVVTHTRALPL